MSTFADVLRSVLNEAGEECFASADALTQALQGRDVSPLMRNLAIRCASYGLTPTRRFDTQPEVNRYIRATSEKLELEHGIVNSTARDVAGALASAFANFDASAAAASAQQRPMGIKLRSGVVSTAPQQPAAPAPGPAIPAADAGKKEKKGLFSFFGKKK